MAIFVDLGASSSFALVNICFICAMIRFLSIRPADVVSCGASPVGYIKIIETYWIPCEPVSSHFPHIPLTLARQAIVDLFYAFSCTVECCRKQGTFTVLRLLCIYQTNVPLNFGGSLFTAVATTVVLPADSVSGASCVKRIERTRYPVVECGHHLLEDRQYFCLSHIF